MRLKNKIAFLFVLFICIESSFGQETDSIEIKIDGYVNSYLEMNAWSGVISIYSNKNQVFQKAYGLADREWQILNTVDTRFRIASISKVFTEVAILKLVEDGKISLDEKLSDFILDFPRGNEITIKQLLTHRSGIPHLNSFPNYNDLIKQSYDINELIDLFKFKLLDFEPGERYRYSNSGYVLLVYIIEKVTGKTYEQFLQQEIFDKVGLKNTGVDNNQKILEKRANGYMFDNRGHLVNADYVDMSIKVGGGSLYSTANDLHIFINNLFQNKLLTTTLPELPNFNELNGKKVFSANGRVQGFCHQITHFIDEDFTIIILGNQYSNIALPISEDVYKIYKNEDYKTPKNYLFQRVEVPIDKLKEYEGSYDFGFGPIGVVKVIENELYYSLPGKNSFDNLIPLGNDIFFYIQNWVLLKFRKNENDNYQYLDWIMGDNVYPAEKIRSN